MMRQLAILSFLLATGCGAATYHVMESPTRPFREFTAVLIEPLQMEDWMTFQCPDPPLYEPVLATAPYRIAYGALGYLERYFRIVDQPEEGTLIVQLELIDFVPGSRARRYWLGGGSGKGHIGVRAVFLATDSEYPVAVADVYGSVVGGWFGGSIESAYDRCGRGIADFIYDHY
jgi:hypothetical protein